MQHRTSNFNHQNFGNSTQAPRPNSKARNPPFAKQPASYHREPENYSFNQQRQLPGKHPHIPHTRGREAHPKRALELRQAKHTPTADFRPDLPQDGRGPALEIQAQMAYPKDRPRNNPPPFPETNPIGSDILPGNREPILYEQYSIAKQRITDFLGMQHTEASLRRGQTEIRNWFLKRKLGADKNGWVNLYISKKNNLGRFGKVQELEGRLHALGYSRSKFLKLYNHSAHRPVYQIVKQQEKRLQAELKALEREGEQRFGRAGVQGKGR